MMIAVSSLPVSRFPSPFLPFWLFLLFSDGLYETVGGRSFNMGNLGRYIFIYIYFEGQCSAPLRVPSWLYPLTRYSPITHSPTRFLSTMCVTELPRNEANGGEMGRQSVKVSARYIQSQSIYSGLGWVAVWCGDLSNQQFWRKEEALHAIYLATHASHSF